MNIVPPLQVTLTSLQTVQTTRLEGLHSYFQNMPVRINEFIYFILVLIIVGMALAALKFAFNLVRRNHRENEFLSVSKSSEVQKVLLNLFHKGSKIDFRFADANGKGHLGEGCINFLDSQKLLLECVCITTGAENWIGRNIECYFQTRSDKGIRHNIFTAPISRVEVEDDRHVHITLPLPQRIEARQKRATLRIMPAEESVVSMAIWGVHEDALPSSETRLGNPDMLYSPKTPGQFFLENISAGGVRLRLPYEKKPLFPAAIKPGSLFYFLITLRDNADSDPASYWMLCRIRTMNSTPELESYVLGCQFLAYAQQQEDLPGLLKWKKLENNTEILSLSNWIFKSHLDIYRKKGIDISR